MNYIDRLSSKISKYKPEDYNELISFWHRMWKSNRPDYLDELYWNWQFKDNPYESTPQIWVFKDNCQICGYQAAVPIILKVRDEYHCCPWAVDIVVEPNFRNKGIGYLLTKELNKTTDMTLALDIRDDAYSMYKKDGWMDIGDIFRFVKILDAKCLIRKKLKIPIISEILSTLINLYFKLRNSKLTRIYNKNHIQIDQIDRFDEQFDKFWELVSDNYPLIVQRDAKYLNWKYVSQPCMNYVIFQMKNGDKISGYIVLRIRYENNRKVGYIVDLLAAPEQSVWLISKAVHYFKAEKATTIVCYVLNEKIETLMKKFGFHLRGPNPKFMIKVNNLKLTPEILRNRANWFITCGDSNMDQSWDR